ncbi:Uncharacterized protein OS=Chthoniobacter flavus Ellin428 GN=CfE428DRAFT_6185 PE=4 SV=1 [Tuwongella immobilis]|uniref:Uncharacterized protein n=1 Tax=Tuwongella immobilis TaxID=692036 RepID=A0A6C2YRD6_9BACT|nr:Uncharacterized protein OS=Chthoniobacter flavus Ellin428 GN=CfE428DRAFT_6185 PE=4 SV=1 [Tuwongella immobilis]VTS04826.1 Uncharacterized protein OS=Chthoniobacter flavus Ellin428 GN=CfE428DRAFT_6185 PE=4 SV=1 [Tuwongella immobilis]
MKKGGKGKKVGACTAAGNCFAAGTMVWLGSCDTDGRSQQRIEQVRLGQRVLTWLAGESSGEHAAADTGIDPASWRVVHLRWDYPDGGGSVEAELLRSADWMIAHSVPPVGQTIRLDLPEMGAEGNAIVTAIEACPEIAPGCGRLVVSRFRHSQGEVYELRLVGSDGISRFRGAS